METEALTDIGCGLISSSLPGAAPEPGRAEPQRFLYVDFASDPLSGQFLRSSVNSICKKLDILPEFKMCRSFSSAMVEVSCGRGILLVDEWSSARSNSEFSYIPMEKRVPIYMTHLPAAADSLLRFFVDETLKVFGNNY